MAKSNFQKWCERSTNATKLKFALEKILHDDFTEEEKKSQQYEDLQETVALLFDHALHDYREKKEKERKEKEEKLQKENEKLKKKSAIFSIRTGIISIVGVVIAKLVETGIMFLFTGGGPTP